MGNTFFFLVDFIIAQNLEKVKFWNLLSGASERSERREGGKEGRKGGERSNGRRKIEQNRKIGYVGKGGGVAGWRSQFLPFARKATPDFTCQYMAIKKVIRKAIFFQKRLDILHGASYNLTVARNKPTDTNRGEGYKPDNERRPRSLKLDNGIWYHNDKKGKVENHGKYSELSGHYETVGRRSS